jgi:hypothetical protein
MPASVKIFHSAQTGAPVLSGQVGALKTLLDACLLSAGGYNSKSVSSISLSGTEATVSCTSHGYLLYDTVLISGSTGVSGLNDVWQISEITDASTFKFETTLTGSPAGTINAKIAPGNWTADYTGTNKSTYKAATGNQHILRVDDTDARYPDVQVWEGATDVDTSTGYTIGTRYWIKSTTADSTARDWTLFLGRNQTFIILFIHNFASYLDRPAFYYFGEFTPILATETYNTIFAGAEENYGSWSGSLISSYYISFSVTATYVRGCHFLLSIDGSTAAKAQGLAGLATETTNYELGRNSGIAYPSVYTGGVTFAPLWVWENLTSDYNFRGVLPGLWEPREQSSNSISTGTVLEIGTKKFWYKVIAGSSSSYYNGVGIDITGPWT